MEFEMPVDPGSFAAAMLGLIVGLLGMRFAWKLVNQFPREKHEGERIREARAAEEAAAAAEAATAEGSVDNPADSDDDASPADGPADGNSKNDG